MVVLMNAATQDMHMNATAADIFWDEGGKKSVEAKSEWDVYDLWANRMPDSVAEMILGQNTFFLCTHFTHSASSLHCFYMDDYA